MPITKEEALLVKATWNIVILNSEEAGNLFYLKLFEIDPSLRKLFPNDMKMQIQKLMATITYLVSRVETLKAIDHEIEGLAKRHVAYGVKSEHYAIAGDALLWTLEKELGNNWTEKTKLAWAKTYSMIAETMDRASASSM